VSPHELVWFLPFGYAISVAIELPVLAIGLAPHHPGRRRVAAAFLLTAATYPVVGLVLPLLIESRLAYLAVAETFAPVAECLLFHVGFRRSFEPPSVARDTSVIVAANLASFGFGELLWSVL
jgi:hypothetical protein